MHMDQVSDGMNILFKCSQEREEEGRDLSRLYRRPSFNCENLITANCEFFLSSQTFDSQTYSINSPPLHAISQMQLLNSQCS